MATTTQTVIAIDRVLWREFKAECIRHEVSPTAVLAGAIKAQLIAWNMERHKKEAHDVQR